MTALDKAWRLADGQLVSCVGLGCTCDTCTLARAVLALRPIVERAIAMQDIDAELVGMGIGGISVEDRRLYTAVADLYDALDELRGTR